jgi:tetratricopeptide (TPR) repeat protein
VALSEQGLEALKHLPSSRERLEHAIDLRFDLRTSLATLGEFPRILDYLHEAEDLATTLGDQRRLGRVCAYLADCYRQTGDYTRAIEAGQRALLIAEEHADVALQVATNIYFGQAHFNMGLYRSGSRFLSENVAILVGELGQERLGLPYVASVHSRTWLTLYLAELGEFAEGIRRGEESLQIAESVGHPFSLTSAYWGLGHLYLRKGDLSRAIPALERGLELSRVWNVHVLFPPLAAGLGSAYSLSGRVSEAVPLLEQAAERQASIRGTAGQSARLSALSHVYLLSGRMEDASKLAARALDLSREHNEVGNESWALWVLAEIASRRDPLDPEKAEHFYRQALAQAALLEMRPLVARCHVGLGAIFRRTGSRSSAGEHLAEAIALFRDMDMAAALEHAQAERKALL